MTAVDELVKRYGFKEFGSLCTDSFEHELLELLTHRQAYTEYRPSYNPSKLPKSALLLLESIFRLGGKQALHDRLVEMGVIGIDKGRLL